MILLLLFLINLSYVIAKKSKSCFNENGIPFTGYRIENQINLRTIENDFYLLYCNENRLVSYIELNNSIPWTQTIDFGNSDLILARRKSYALREIPIYLPNIIIGSLNINETNSGNKLVSHPLVSENILNNWLEITHKLEFIYHVPVFSTPRIDSKNFETMADWDKYIHLKEEYNYKYDPRSFIQKKLDLLINFLNQSFSLNLSDSENLIRKLIFISKTISTTLALKIIQEIDRISSYDSQ